jgi:hypothetical protein
MRGPRFDEPEVFRFPPDWTHDEVRFTLRIPVKWWVACRWPRVRLYLLMQRFLWRTIVWTRRSASLP